jgi:hypothetical protein
MKDTMLAPNPLNFDNLYFREEDGKTEILGESYPLEYFRRDAKIWCIHNHKGQIDWYVRHERGIFMHRQIGNKQHSKFDYQQMFDGCGGCLLIAICGLMMCFTFIYFALKLFNWIDNNG